jgi:AcrR family transcriptional regulator
MTLVERVGTQEQRVIDAALRCIARWGIGKTTLDDVAREAACSRATIYRLFPGGKEALLDAVARNELDRFFSGLAQRFDEAPTLEDLLVDGIVYASRALSGHEALQFVLAYEPELVLPKVAFHHADRVLSAVSAFAAPYLAPHVGEEGAPRLVVVSAAAPPRRRRRGAPRRRVGGASGSDLHTRPRRWRRRGRRRVRPPPGDEVRRSRARVPTSRKSTQRSPQLRSVLQCQPTKT